MKNILKKLASRIRPKPNFFRNHKLFEIIGGAEPIILDIGAYDGGEIEEIFECWSKAKVFAFEIDKEAIIKFRTKWSKEIEKGQVVLVEKAVCEELGTTQFFPSLERLDNKYGYGVRWAMSGSINKPKKHLDKWAITFGEPLEVQSTRLDEWCLENLGTKTIDLIYADVNGGERELIEGGLDTLQNRTRLFYTEYFDEEIYEGQPSKDWILSRLTNFELAEIIGHNMLLQNRKLA